MGGLFGGFLGLVNSVGGGAMSILVGQVAWKENEIARRCRLGIGAVIVGLILAIPAFVVTTSLGYFGNDFESRLGACFLGIPLPIILIVFVLEHIKERLEE